MNKDNIIKILRQSSLSDGFISYVEKNLPKNYKKVFNKPYDRGDLENPIMDLDPQRRVIESLGELAPLEEYYISSTFHNMTMKSLPAGHGYYMGL